MAKNPFYVYALKDPRQTPARPFYIGKGTGNRAWEHELNIDESEKGAVIKEIHESGLSVVHSVLVDNLEEVQALKVEAELISAFGIRTRGGLLTNKVRPNSGTISERPMVNVPDGCYEKAQLGLELLRESVIELARANVEGVRNSDVAKYLGLQSDYGGGAKDYLSYSVLGLLLRDGQLTRTESKRHIPTGAK